MAELISNSAGLSPSELAQRKEDLKQKYKHQLADFDHLTEELVLKAEKDLLPQLEIEETNARLSLREKQLKELADAMKRLTPEEELHKQYADDAQKAEEEAKKYKDDNFRRMQEEMDERKRKMLEEEERKKRKMAEDLKALEAELEEERLKEEEREKRREADRESTRQKQLEERKKKDLEDIQKKQVSEDEKDRLLKEHQENMANFEEGLRKERDRGRESLQAKLEARRAQRASVSKAKLLSESVIRNEDSQKRSMVGEDDEVKQPGKKPAAAPASASGELNSCHCNLTIITCPSFRHLSEHWPDRTGLDQHAIGLTIIPANQ